MDPQEPNAKFGDFQDAPQVLAPLPGHIDSVEAVALQPWKQFAVCVCPEMWDLPQNMAVSVWQMMIKHQHLGRARFLDPSCHVAHELESFGGHGGG